MDKPEICKICNKSFANGKAMGGHMRSHLHFAKVNPVVPTKPQKPFIPPPTSSSHSSSYSSSSSVNYSLESYPILAMNPARASSHANPSGVRSTEVESVRNPTGRRSKRRRKSMVKVSESVHSDPGRVSSCTFTSDNNNNNNSVSEEDAASCLLMMKRGKGIVSEVEDLVVVDASIDKYVDEDDEETEEGEFRVEKEVEEDQEEEEEPYRFSISGSSATVRIRTQQFSIPPKQSKPPSKGKFRCEECDKGFKSYQALGGHMASHKKVRPSKTLLASNKEYHQKHEDHLQASASSDLAIGRRVFKCSFCDKEFESGQALGGHKKVHFPYLGNNPSPNPKTNATNSSVAASRDVKNYIDLNVLPPEAQEDL